MEILFYRYGSICEPDLIAIFSAFGLNVITEESEITKKSILPSERVRTLSALLETHTFTFVFSINFFPSVSDTCEIFHVPYVCWVVDSPVMELFSKSILNSCNKIFLFDRAQYQLLSAYHPDGIFHLPLATNVKRWDTANQQITDSDRQKYHADISFIGSLYSEKDPYLSANGLSDQEKGFIDGLIAAQSQVYGCNFLEDALSSAVVLSLKKALPGLFLKEEHSICNTDRYVAAHEIIGMHEAYLERVETLKKLSQFFSLDLYTQSDTALLSDCSNIHLKGTAKTLTEMPKIFHLSKINLNMTIRPIQTGLSLRIWDIMGSGGFLMCNYQEELFDHFTPGVDLETYASLEELTDKCSFYLSHEKERMEIAMQGYKKVSASHTYEKRITQMIHTIYQTL